MVSPVRFRPSPPHSAPEHTREKRRPGRCYRAADVARLKIRTGVFPSGKERGAGTGGELLEVSEPDPLETGAKGLGRHPDRRLRSSGEREDRPPSGRRHTAELLEERDHVLEHDEIELPVGERKLGAVGHLEVDAAAQISRAEPLRLLDHLGGEVDADHLRLGEALGDDTRGLAAPSSEVESLPRRCGEPVEGRTERKQALRTDAGLPARGERPELPAQGSSKNAPERRVSDNGSSGQARKAPARGLDALSHADVRRSSSPTRTENICAAFHRLMARAMFA